MHWQVFARARHAARHARSAFPSLCSDGTLNYRPQDQGSKALELVKRIGQMVRQDAPSVVMTWGPDGGYGHGDHRMMSDTVTQVIQGMAPDQRPDLLFAAFPEPDAPLPGFEDWATTHPSLVSDRIEYTATDLQATREAMACYESQFPPAALAGLPDLLHGMVWHGAVSFRAALPNR